MGVGGLPEPDPSPDPLISSSSDGGVVGGRILLDSSFSVTAVVVLLPDMLPSAGVKVNFPECVVPAVVLVPLPTPSNRACLLNLSLETSM